MQGNKSRDTQPELAIRRRLHRDGFRFRVAARPEKDLRRTADILFPKAKVAVYLDGCFWHGCPVHSHAAKVNSAYWTAKLAGNRHRDAETDSLLAIRGWRVLRFWEHEDLSEVVCSIELAVRHD
jgi:DNA mismatch endonuclease (patch repair protein)